MDVPDGGCVFDVGANIGLYSIYLSRLRRGLSIFAFEPLPQIFRLLELRTVGRPRAAEFEFDRLSTLASTMYPD